jgi:small subunit ribosomal protein S4e
MSKHMKRMTIPRSWPLPRKTHTWILRPSAGPHPIEYSLPLLVIIRDILGYCKNRKEGMNIINSRHVMVDGKVVTNEKHPVGLMDVLSLPKAKDHFRVVLDDNGKLRLVKISDKEAKWKLARIESKTTLKNGRTQLNLHDGRNMLLDSDKYNTGDVLKIEIPGQKILATYPFKEGSIALMVGGQHVGETATIEKYVKVRNPKANIVHFREGFSTVWKHVFVIGKDKPEIFVPRTHEGEEK